MMPVNEQDLITTNSSSRIDASRSERTIFDHKPCEFVIISGDSCFCNAKPNEGCRGVIENNFGAICPFITVKKEEANE